MRKIFGVIFFTVLDADTMLLIEFVCMYNIRGSLVQNRLKILLLLYTSEKSF